MAEEQKLNILSTKTDDENIEEVLSKAGIVTEDIVNKAAEQIAKRREEKVTKELIDLVQKCEFIKNSTLIRVRRAKKKSRLQTQYLKDMTEVIDSVTSGKTSLNDVENKLGALKKKLNEDLRANDNVCDDAMEKLREIFPDSWRYTYSNLLPD